MKKILAIDPGASGGFAWSDSSGRKHCKSMPETEGDIVGFLAHSSCMGFDFVIVEHVVGFIPGGGFGSGFSFGENFGMLKGLVQGFGMPLVLVRPPKWQKALSLGAKKDWDKQWKNHLKETAQRLFPACDGITLKTADALLILHYAEQNL